MAQKSFPCGQCGAELDFQPGTAVLKCAHCGFENPVPEARGQVLEVDYRSALVDLERAGDTFERITVKCPACAAETTLAQDVAAAECPFCGSNIVATGEARTAIKPHSVLPFRITRDQAWSAFRSWISKLWFAPSGLKRFALSDSRFTGLYIPYWTYDCDTTSDYSGERGDDYWETQHYTAQENGKTVHKTRQVRKTRWRHVSGRVANSFDDVLVLASRSLPKTTVEKLEPWDIEDLVPYADEYLSGFRAESYQVGLKEGFSNAQQIMDGKIRSTVCADIGGDHQRIHSLETDYRNITFKHILLPVWMSAYRFKDKIFRFLVNARTGEVQGERPWSVWKIVLLVLAVLAAAAGVWAIAAMR